MKLPRHLSFSFKQVDGRRQLFFRVKHLKIRITGADSDLLRSGIDRWVGTRLWTG